MAVSLLRPVTALRLFATKISKNPFQVANISDHERQLIGKREIVGYGFNGNPNYCDRNDFPFPSIRWKEPKCETEALREKEKGDWNELTYEEKKDLYRYSYCQTFVEFNCCNRGEWKSLVAGVLFLIAPAFWLYYYFKLTIYRCQPLPDSFKEENRAAQFRRYLDLKANPIEGLASKWDYEKDDWKNPRDSWKSK